MLRLATTNGGGATSYVVLGALVVVSFLVRQGRLQSRGANLNPGERLRPLAISCIDPLISLLIIGPLLWKLASHHSGNLAGAVGGAVIGVVIGYFRARVMFVRTQKRTRSVVLRRSGIEYALVAVLIVLREIEGSLELDHVSTATVAVAALAALGLVEAFARAGFIIGRYVAHRELPTSTGVPDLGSPDADDSGAEPGVF